MYEHHSEPLLPPKHFLLRMLRSAVLGLGLIALGLIVGALGYWYFEDLSGVDALLNAAMILTGMGPVNVMHTHTGKLFATAYAVFSGVAFPTTIGIMMAPAVHRFLHKLHLDEQDDKEDEKKEAAK
jgi:hypothetical protein